ncbi:type II pantothenate kinase [Peribacillus sp. B-H-3]|jgi:type II pantothenate kinase|uniref:type II pantothenate kinase n=1 Tax=Peribacillus sp. B-H-3 TaxID=3400420 RepID=UPI003B024A2F
MVQSIGIDAGGSLLKLAYIEKGQLHVKAYDYSDIEMLLQWIAMVGREAKIGLTGGKAAFVQSKLPIKASYADEFEMTLSGAAFLLSREEKNTAAKILVSIGTGTSIYLLHGTESKRISGSGLGGGTLTGLSSLLLGTANFKELVSYAAKGDRSQADLQVRDIYGKENPPIPGHFTASNFGKAAQMGNPAKEDIAASLMGMIAETAVLLAVGAAHANRLKDICFIGGTLVNNIPLKQAVKEASAAFGCEAHFPDRGEYSGAIGALISL